MKNPPTHRNDADLQITIFSHDLCLCGESCFSLGRCGECFLTINPEELIFVDQS